MQAEAKSGERAFYCEVCDLQCGKQGYLENHLRGKRHADAMDKMKNGMGVIRMSQQTQSVKSQVPAARPPTPMPTQVPENPRRRPYTSVDVDYYVRPQLKRQNAVCHPPTPLNPKINPWFPGKFCLPFYNTCFFEVKIRAVFLIF